MGTFTEIRVGAYVECKNELIEVSKKAYYCDICSDSRNEATYCFVCGEKLLIHDVATGETTTKINEWDLIEDLDENLMPVNLDSNDYAVFVPNGTYPWAYDLVDLKDIQIEILPNFSIKAIKWFKSEYSKEIKLLQKQYGTKNVVVKYGIIKYGIIKTYN